MLLTCSKKCSRRARQVDRERHFDRPGRSSERFRAAIDEELLQTIKVRTELRKVPTLPAVSRFPLKIRRRSTHKVAGVMGSTATKHLCLTQVDGTSMKLRLRCGMKPRPMD